MAGVEHDAAAAQRVVRKGAGEELFVLLDERAIFFDRDLRNRHVIAANREQLVLDLFLDSIGELHPVVTEHLHAVVFERVVRRGDRDARRRVGDAAEIRDRGCRNDADETRFAAAVRDAGGKRARDLGT